VQLGQHQVAGKRAALTPIPPFQISKYHRRPDNVGPAARMPVSAAHKNSGRLLLHLHLIDAQPIGIRRVLSRSMMFVSTVFNVVDGRNTACSFCPNRSEPVTSTMAVGLQKMFRSNSSERLGFETELGHVAAGNFLCPHRKSDDFFFRRSP